MTDKPPLKEFQRENVEWIRKEKRGLLADEPGLGKSRSALEGFHGVGRVLIVAPAMVLQAGVWNEEVEKWGDDDCKYYVAPYSMLNDLKDQRTPAQVKAGKPLRNKPIKRLRQEWRGHWDAVIVDEAHYIKGRGNYWTWATTALARNCDNFLALTGTPIPNWSHELFTILQCIHPEEGKRGHEQLGSFWRWADRYFDTSPSEFSGTNPTVGPLLGCTPKCGRRNADDPCKHYLRFAEDNLGAKYMRHLRDDHLDLPPIQFMDVPVPLEREANRAYAELRDSFATDIGGAELLAWSQGAKNVMMDKLTTSPWLLNKRGEPRGGKFEQLRFDLERRERPTLVFGHYKDTVEACARIGSSVGARTAYIHGGTSERSNAAAVRDFRAGKIDVLVGSLETLAEGVTLTVADTAIFVERSYKPSRNVQATYRVYRMGQDKSVTIRRYIAPNTVDSGKEILLAKKNDHQMRTLSAAELLRVA